MPFKKVVQKVRDLFLCCRKYRKKGSLNIGSPTDVRRVDISDALPGLTDAERKYIREKASSDAIHLLGLQSHPPSLPATSLPSPTDSRSSLGPVSGLSSREPSVALLNAASKDLPNTLPTPPRQKHNESSPPTARMKSMWEAPRKSSSSSSSRTRNELFEKLEQVKDDTKDKKADPNESFMTLNLEFEFEDKKDLPDTPRTLSLDNEGFETQSTIGGRSEASSPVAVFKSNPFEKSPVVQRAIRATALGDSSDSEEEILLASDRSPMVKI